MTYLQWVAPNGMNGRMRVRAYSPAHRRLICFWVGDDRIIFDVVRSELPLTEYNLVPGEVVSAWLDSTMHVARRRVSWALVSVVLGALSSLIRWLY